MPEIPIFEKIKVLLQQKIKEFNLEEDLEPYLRGFLEGGEDDNEGLGALLYNLGSTMAKFLTPGADPIDDFAVTRYEASLIDLDDSYEPKAKQLIRKLEEIEKSFAEEGIYTVNYINELW
jgi:hypothetical protein